MYQTLAQEFDMFLITENGSWKTRRSQVFLTKVRGVWKHDQTLVRMFDTTSQTNTYFRRKKEKVWLILQVFDHISKPVTLVIFFCLSFVNY